jgi:tetratricopeptide (TPR) repeat protein
MAGCHLRTYVVGDLLDGHSSRIHENAPESANPCATRTQFRLQSAILESSAVDSGTMQPTGDDEAIVERLRRPEAERALEAFRESMKHEHGLVVFAAGTAGSGRTALLRMLRRDFGRRYGHDSALAGGFVNGEYQPWPDDEPHAVRVSRKAKPVIDGLLALGGPALSALPYGAPAVSVAKFASQLVQTSLAAQDLAGTLGPGEVMAASADKLKDLLRRAAEERPLVWLLDDLDRATNRFYWSEFIQRISREISIDLPVFALITLKSGEGSDRVSAPHRVVERLVESGEAEKWTLSPLGPSDLSRLLGPCSNNLWELLIGATEGNPRYVEKLWREWRQLQTVYQDTYGAWTLVDEAKAKPASVLHDVLRDRLTILVGDDPVVLDDAVRLVGVAALEGREFTGDVLARVVQRDRDALIDLLDDKFVVSEKVPLGILRKVDSIELDDNVHGKRHFWRYGFVSDLHWQTLRRYGLSPKDRRLTSLVYANELAEAHGPHDEKVAAILAELFAHAGAREKSEEYQRLADFTRELESVEALARACLTADRSDWHAIDYAEALSLAIHTGELLATRSRLREAQAYFEAAVELARATRARFDEAYGLYRSGNIAGARFEYATAIPALTAAREYFAEHHHRQYEAVALLSLADVALGQSDRALARTLLDDALKLARDEGSLPIEARAIFILGKTYLHEDPNAAKRLLSRALELERQSRGSAEDRLGIRMQLALVDLELGHTEVVREQLIELVQEAKAGHVAPVELVASRTLGYALAVTGQFAEARIHLASALTIAKALESPFDEAATLHGFAALANELNNAALAFVCEAMAFTTLTSIEHPLAHSSWRQLLKWFEAEDSESRQSTLLSTIHRIAQVYRDDGGKALTGVLLEGDLRDETPYMPP